MNHALALLVPFGLTGLYFVCFGISWRQGTWDRLDTILAIIAGVGLAVMWWGALR